MVRTGSIFIPKKVEIRRRERCSKAMDGFGYWSLQQGLERYIYKGGSVAHSFHGVAVEAKENVMSLSKLSSPKTPVKIELM